MHKSRRLVIVSLALVALVFTGAYALAGDGGDDGDPQAAPAATKDAPSAIETPEGIDVPGAPPGGELPELQVPEPSATPGDAGPGLEPTPTPEPSTPDTPDPAPTPQPTPQPTPAPTEPPITRGGGED